MHNLFLHSTYLFIETKHFHIVRNCFENNNWMGYWGQTKLIGACGLPPAQHKHLKYQRAKHKHTIANIKTHTHKYTIAPKYMQLTLSIGCKNFNCSVNFWICEQSHPNILLSITFLYIQLHTPSSYISSPSTASDLQFSIPRFSRRPPPRIMIAFALTSQLYIHLTPLHFHVSAFECTQFLSWVHNCYNLLNESWIMKVHCHEEERTTKIWHCHIAMVGLTRCCGQWCILFKRYYLKGCCCCMP